MVESMQEQSFTWENRPGSVESENCLRRGNVTAFEFCFYLPTKTCHCFWTWRYGLSSRVFALSSNPIQKNPNKL
jgi:hypothetical protein